MLKSDNQGFLIGELLAGQRETLDFQHQVLPMWRSMRTDVRSIARLLGANAKPAEPAGRGAGRTSGTATLSAERSRAAAARPRDAAGRFVASVRAVVPKRSAREEQQTEKVRAQAVAAAAGMAAKTAVADRDGRGRFLGKGGAGDPDKPGDDSPGLGARIAERLGDIKTAIGGVTAGAEQVDPAITAAHEVKDVVAPLGRGMFAMFDRTAEKKKERWYKRFLSALTGRKQEAQAPAAITPSEGMGIGAVAGGVARFLPLLLTGLGSLLGMGLAGFLGTKLGGAIYDWLDKSGIATKVFDAFDALKDWIKGKVDAVKQVAQDFNSARELARQGIGGAAPVLDARGRNSNDERRLDMPKGAAATAGSVVGTFQRGWDLATGEASRTAAENRALITGRKYRAGNIGGLDDAHTRALVASTVATESGGGNLGVVNKAGYMGRYQAGAGWLADAGLIKGGSAAVKAAMKADGFSSEYEWGKAGGMTRFLQNDANWNNGLSYGKYLRSADVQDTAFKSNSDKAYQDLLRRGVITSSTSQEEVAGLLKARHIAGLGGAQAVAAGGTGAADANGTTARKYYEDVTRDRGGFLAAYSGSAAAVGTQKVPAVSVPSPVPEKIPAAAVVEAPPPAKQEKDKPVRAVLREPVGQDVGDRKIAHIVSGGIGG